MQNQNSSIPYKIGDFSFQSFMDDENKKIYFSENCFVSQVCLKKYANRREILRSKIYHDAPYYFGHIIHNAYYDEKELQDSFFGLFRYDAAKDLPSEATIIDMVGYSEATIYEPDPSRVFLGCTYIHQGFRGHGFSKMLYQARLDWALNQPEITKASTYTHEANLALIKTAQDFGFVMKPEDAKKALWSCRNISGDAVHYELDLKTYKP